MILPWKICLESSHRMSLIEKKNKNLGPVVLEENVLHLSLHQNVQQFMMKLKHLKYPPSLKLIKKDETDVVINETCLADEV